MSESNPVEASEAGRAIPSSAWITLGMVFLGLVTADFDGIARGIALPVMLKPLHLNIAQAGLIFTGSYIMSWFANLVAGMVMDRWGRKPAFLLALLCTGLFSGLTAFVNSPAQYAVLGVLSGTLRATIPTGQVLVGEEAPASRRGLFMGLATSGIDVGVVITGIVAAAVLPHGGWRTLFLIAFFPLVVAALGMWVLREPPASSHALKQKRGVARRTGLQELGRIFERGIRKHTIGTTVFGMLVNVMTGGFVLSLSASYFTIYDKVTIHDAALSLTVFGLATIVGSVTIGWLADRWPSRNLLAGWTIIGGVAAGLLAIKGGTTWIYFMMGAIGFFGTGALATFWRYLTDSYPTAIRGTGNTFATAFYFLGGALGPALFGILIHNKIYAVAPMFAGALSLIGAVVLLSTGRLVLPGKELDNEEFSSSAAMATK